MMALYAPLIVVMKQEIVVSLFLMILYVLKGRFVVVSKDA